MPSPQQELGSRSEAIILSSLVRCGLKVLMPWNENERYDLAVDLGDGRMARIQCKTGRKKKSGAIHFSTSSTWNGKKHKTYLDETELFAIYCPETDAVYLVEPTRVGTRRGCLPNPEHFLCDVVMQREAVKYKKGESSEELHSRLRGIYAPTS